MRLALLMTVSIFLIGCSNNGFVTNGADSYRYVVSKGNLYAIISHDHYGTEHGVLKTASLDHKWAAFEAPEKTIDVCESADQLFALTSKAQLWKKSGASSEWNRFWSGGAEHQWAYDVECMPSGDVAVITSNAILLLTSDGKPLREFPSLDKTMFVRSFVATDHQLIVECNPYTVAVLDTQEQKLKGWNDGFASLSDKDTHGPCLVRPHGDRFLACRADGIYISDGILQPWRILTSEFAFRGINTNFCRELVSLDPLQDSWLVATNSGVHLMNGSQKQKTVFQDARDDHDLIRQIVPLQDEFLISFVRLHNSMGVRLPKDLTRWETIRP